jgi:hypothetical protein
MKKLISLTIILLIGLIFTGCPQGSVTRKTIKTVRVMLFSFDKNGIYPYLEKFNKNELGISVYADSLSETVEYAQSFSFGNKAFAMEDPNEIYYTNTIDLLNFITLYDFDADHPAGSNINDILLFLDGMGKTREVEIGSLSDVSHFFKFSAIPQNDSMQFEISGRITGEHKFSEKTELVILN